MVTEAEAAFLYVQTLYGRDHKQTLKDNKEYMVVDLGGIMKYFNLKYV